MEAPENEEKDAIRPEDKPVNRRDALRESGRGLARFFFHLADEAMDLSLGSLLSSPPPSSPAAGSAKHTLLRPPGAVAEADFLAGCTRCGDCITACHPKAIFKAPAGALLVEGTPVIDPLLNPCVLCTDLPCIAACEPGVLKMVKHEDVRMGRAVILESKCLAHQGQECRHCLHFCPFPETAIRFVEGLPEILAEGCTGCGICSHYCHTLAGSAILMRPL